MDNNVPPYNTLLVVNELIKANKDFDLIMLPNRGHGFGNEPYMVRRRWDYFVRYLLGAEPPVGYELHAPEGGGRGGGGNKWECGRGPRFRSCRETQTKSVTPKRAPHPTLLLGEFEGPLRLGDGKQRRVKLHEGIVDRAVLRMAREAS